MIHYKTRFIQLMKLLCIILFITGCKSNSGNDKAVIRELLEINGITDKQIDDIVFWGNGRVVELSVTELNINIIPDTINKLTSLKFAHFTNKKIERFPDSFCDLTNLEGLSISEHSLIELPDCIGNLTNLKAINIFSYKLKEMPNSFLKLSNLTDVSFNSMAIETIPLQLLNKSIRTLFINCFE